MRLNRKTKVKISGWARSIGRLLINIINYSLRLEVQGWSRIRYLLISGKPLVLQIWHGDMFIAWSLLAPLKPTAIVSQAGDGDIASAILEGLGFVTFRGSSTRGGRKAYSQMIQYLKSHPYKISAFASDGPQGPRRILKAGTLVAAQHLDAYIIPCSFAAKHALRMKSWDRFFIPLPFTRAKALFGKPIAVDRSLRGKALDKKLLEISDLCRSQQEELEMSFHNGG